MTEQEAAFARLVGNRYYGVGGLKVIKAFVMNYTNFTGRSSRSEYWWFTLWSGILGMIGGIALAAHVVGEVMRLIDAGKDVTALSPWAILFGGSVPLAVAAIGVWLVFLVPSMALGIRRFRDAGVHWAWYLLLSGISWLTLLIPRDLAMLQSVVSMTVVIVIVVIAALPSKPVPDAPTAA